MSTVVRATRKLYIVSRAEPELHARLSHYFAPAPDVTVVLDRRQGQRRACDESAGRRRHDISEELAARGWALVETDTVEEPAAAATRATLVLQGVSGPALAALRGRSHVLARFPFAIERCGDIGGQAVVLDTRLAVPDREPFHVSRRHCVIIRQGTGFAVVDTTSRLGTIVNGVRIGGNTGRLRAPLAIGTNEVALGGRHTPYVFHLAVEASDEF